MTVVPLSTFLESEGTLVDVRSPSEYALGHIFGAASFPLLSDQERAIVGTLYKTKGRDQAIEEGLALLGGKVDTMIEEAQQLFADGYARVYCWRGGMRSGSVAHLLESIGVEATVLQGGYKTYRQWVLKVFTLPWKFQVLGGPTGCGKTHLLHDLEARGEQVIDLEGLAHHRGSSYGCLGLPPQPPQQIFENALATKLYAFDPEKTIWIEDESRMVGCLPIPQELFRQMAEAPLFLVEKTLDERLDILMEDYGHIDHQQMIAATTRIRKRLGGERYKKIIDAFERGNFRQAVSEVLDYYDRTYEYNLSKRSGPTHSFKRCNQVVG